MEITGTRAASDLAVELAKAEGERVKLTGILVRLSQRRADLLVQGTDHEVDAVEAELAAVTRKLDRLDARLSALEHEGHVAADAGAVSPRHHHSALAAFADACDDLAEVGRSLIAASALLTAGYSANDRRRAA